ncbi:hypothetical protein [Methylobacterium durans]|uniref:hypothetical protein n=1 Tax=Methylobacterium durans TaxID=2202825 RepID=UPI0013A56F3A|nr:hypothetical protein [Methylobacterium durans]
MSRFHRFGLVTLAAGGIWGLLAAGACAQTRPAGADSGIRPIAVGTVVAQPCLGVCRSALPPCRVGRRWFGPYGYVCYRPEPYFRPSWLGPL